MINFDLDESGTTDLIAAKQSFAVYQESIQGMQARAAAHIITDDATNQAAVEMAGQTAAMIKSIEKKRKEIVAAPNEFVKAVNQFAKPYTSALEDTGRVLNQKITAYTQQQNRIRLEAQKKAMEEAAKLQAELKKAAEAAQEAPMVIVAPVLQDAPKVTRTASGSASLRTTWAFEVIDFKALPDDYKQVDRVAINAAIKTGMREIPGVRIFEETKTTIRAASLPDFDYEKF